MSFFGCGWFDIIDIVLYTEWYWPSTITAIFSFNNRFIKIWFLDLLNIVLKDHILKCLRFFVLLNQYCVEIQTLVFQTKTPLLYYIIFGGYSFSKNFDVGIEIKIYMNIFLVIQHCVQTIIGSRQWVWKILLFYKFKNVNNKLIFIVYKNVY